MGRLAKFCWGVLAYTVVVVLWGAFVRATGSGAGCGSHWPLCNGEVIPRSPTMETIVEFTHRLSSGLALLAVLAMFIWVFRTYPRKHYVRLGASLSLIFIIAEALVGAGLVLFEWVAHNTSVARAISMPLHLVVTFLLLGSLTLTAWWTSGGAPIRLRGQGGILHSLLGALITMTLLGMSGAVIALGDTLFLGLGVTPEESPLVRTLVAFRPIHPIIGVLTWVFLAMVGYQVARHRPQPVSARLITVLTVLYAVQMLAGAVNVVLKAPVWMQLVHLFLADLIWIALVLLAVTVLAAKAPTAAA